MWRHVGGMSAKPSNELRGGRHTRTLRRRPRYSTLVMGLPLLARWVPRRLARRSSSAPLLLVAPAPPAPPKAPPAAATGPLYAAAEAAVPLCSDRA
jgi:hypothetical protein